MNNSKRDNLSIWAVFICFFSIISQLPFFVTMHKTQIVFFPIWVVCFILFCIISNGRIDRKATFLLVPVVVFLIFVWIDGVVNSANYFSSSLLYSVFISLFVFFVGLFMGESCSDKLYKAIDLSYVITTLIVSIAIFFQYFGFDYDLSTRKYVYSSKNSISQIIFTAIIILIMAYKPKKKWHYILKYGALAVDAVVMLLLRSRAVILELGVCVIVMFLSKNTDKRLKKLMTVFAFICVIVLLASDSARNIIINNTLLVGRDIKDLDYVSSGRLSILSQFPTLIKGHWIFGIGPTYYECFPLSSILQFGLVPGILLIVISQIPLIFSWKYQKQSARWYLLYIISVGYVINGFFEGITPFGTGIKCFYMWFLLGILIAKTKNPIEN